MFIKWVQKYFGPIAKKVVEKINGTKNPLTYLHKSMLSRDYSTDLKWNSLSSNNTMVAADIVALDSPLPLKKRDALSKASGDIPKLGMKLYLNERLMSDLNILQNRKGSDNEIIKKLFGDTKKCTVGVYETLEYMFLQGLSSGVTSITDENNPGIAIRIDFGYKETNKYGAEIPWSNPNAKPLDDIEKIQTAASANGDSIRYIMMDKQTFNVFKKNQQVRESYAMYMGFSITKDTIIPTPDLTKVNQALSANYGVEIQVTDRSVVFEKNGVRTVKKPWEQNMVVFLTDLQVGTLTYGQLAEELHPVDGVQYQKVDDFILLSKYRKNDPLREFTSSQALVLPVIDNVDSIYTLDSEEAATDEQTEGDENFDYNGEVYTLEAVKAALKTVDARFKVDGLTDTQLLAKINNLNAEQIAIFEEALGEPVEVES